MSKVGDLVELFRTNELIEQARIETIKKVSSLLEGNYVDYFLSFGDGASEVFRYKDKKWFKKEFEVSFDHYSETPRKYSYELIDKKEKTPHYLFELKKKFKRINYVYFDNRSLFNDNFEKWRNSFKEKSGKWPSFSQEQEKRIYFKNKFGIP